MAGTVSDLLYAALAEIRVARGGDVIAPDDAALALYVLNEYLDGLNADGRALYTTDLPSPFAIVPTLQPHTIGLAANAPTWSVPIARPEAVLAANLIIANNVRVPLELRDDAWWLNVRVPTLSTAIPTDLWYSPTWPNGAAFLWPVPTVAYQVEVLIKTLLAQVVATDPLDLPPGYQAALRLTLAELLAPMFGQAVSASTAEKARAARAVVWGANDTIPNLVTRDGGQPGGTGGGFNYLTGQVD